MSVCADKERLETELVALRNKKQSLSSNDPLEKVQWYSNFKLAVPGRVSLNTMQGFIQGGAKGGFCPP